MQSMVRGCTWKARMFNGAVFEIWTPTDIKQHDARRLLLEFAEHYKSNDIESIWKTEGERK